MYDTRRVKSREQIEREVDRVEALGIRHVVITDPSIHPESRMEMLSEVFSGRGMAWTGYARPGTWKKPAPYYSRATLERARESGCMSLFFGGESANEATQKRYGKPRLAIIRETEAICKEVGIQSCWSFMVLNPGETRADTDRLIELLTELEPPMVVFGPFAVLPRSEMDRYPARFGLQIRDPDYALKAPEVYAKFSKSAGRGKGGLAGYLLDHHPRLLRFLLRRRLGRANYFECTETGLDFADGVYETLRLDRALRERTSIAVGKSNYHLMFEAAARSVDRC